MDIASLTWSDIILGILLTWMIGLTPPLMIRYVFLKCPLGNWSALLIVILFFIVETVIAVALDDILNGPRTTPQQHPSLLLIALVSYYVLRRPNKPVPAMEPR